MSRSSSKRPEASAPAASDTSPIVPDCSIYQGLEGYGLKVDLQGWNSRAPIFGRLIDLLKPRTIVEVGSWKGASLAHMARLAMAHQPDVVLFAVDTWLGGFDHWVRSPGAIPRMHGYPSLYFQFLWNMRESGLQEHVVPLPNTSANGARYLKHYGVRSKLVYIDGSHEAADVIADLVDYGDNILVPGGVMFGDDYLDRSNPGVRMAVDHFARHAKGFGPMQFEGSGHWWCRKL